MASIAPAGLDTGGGGAAGAMTAESTTLVVQRTPSACSNDTRHGLSVNYSQAEI